MNFEIFIGALNILVAVIVAVFCLAALPFAFKVTRELAQIREALKGINRQDDEISDLQKRVHVLELRCAANHRGHLDGKVSA